MAPTPERVRLALHAGQAAVHRSAARYRAVVAGRRWGKTHLSRVTLTKAAMQARDTLFWYIAPTRIMAKDIMWADLKRVVHPRWMARPALETELAIDLISGSRIQLYGAEDPDSLRGRKLGGVVMDEFADMSPAAWTEAVRPALSDLEGWALFPGTPKSFNHFYEVFQLGQAHTGQWASWQFRTIDNPFINPDEVARARAELDPRTFRQEYEASFEALAGRVYYAFHRATHVQPVQLQRAVPVAVSFDFNVEPATATLGQRIGDEIRVWREVWTAHAGGEATRASARAARELLQQAGWSGAVELYGDAAGSARKTTGPSDHAVIRDVFPGSAWRIKGRSPHVRDRISAVNGRLETMDGRTHCVIDPTCVHLISDLEQVTFAGNGDLDKSNPMLTHISDAFGYWVEAQFPARQVVPISAGWMERFA